MTCTCQSISANVFDCEVHGEKLRASHAQTLLRDANRLINRALEAQNRGDHETAENLLDRAEILTDQAEQYEGAVA